MLVTKIIQRKLFVSNFVHRRAGVGDRTDLIGIELFPPVQRCSDVEIDGNHPHELTVLANMYKSRRNHKLDEWHTFCDWIESLPYSTLITGGVVDE